MSNLLSSIQLKNRGRIRLVSNYTITGNTANDAKIIPKIIAEVWGNHEMNVSDSSLLMDYYMNKTAILSKTKGTRSDILNTISIPRAYEIQRKINSYANGTPREYTSLDNSKAELIDIFNKYQLDECKHSKTQLANYWASITGVGYFCVLPEYSDDDESCYEIYYENFTPKNTFIVYENNIKGDEMLGVNYHKVDVVKEINGIATNVSYTEFNVFTKYHQWVFRTPNEQNADDYSIYQQTITFEPAVGELELKKVDAIPNPFGIIPIVQVNFHPFRMGAFEIVLDLIDCANMFLSGDADAREQAVDYVLVLTDCHFKEEYDENGKLIDNSSSIKNSRLIQIDTNGGNNKAKVEILTNSFDYKTTIDFIDLINSLIEKIVGIPTRKNQDVGGNSSTGTGSKNENGMRDLDDNADIIQSQAILAEKKFVKLVLAIDSQSKNPRLTGLKPIDIKINFPRNEQENIVVSAQAYATMKNAGMNDIDALGNSKITTDIFGTAKRNADAMKEEQAENEPKQSTESIVSTSLKEDIEA